MRRLLLAGALVFVGLGLGLSGGYWRWNFHRAQNYTTVRKDVLHSLSRQQGPIDTLILGDSLTEMTNFAGACGRTFNAGAGGAKAKDAQAVAEDAFQIIHPKTIVVGIGTNHFAHGESGEDFPEKYHQLLDSLPQARLILVQIHQSASANKVIAEEASRRHALVIAPVTGTGMIGTDGIHYTPSGSIAFRKKVEGACRLAPA